MIVRKATLLEELFGGLHEGADLYPADEVVPTGVSAAQQRTVDLSEMKTSQQIAAAVALRALGRKVTIDPDRRDRLGDRSAASRRPGSSSRRT